MLAVETPTPLEFHGVGYFLDVLHKWKLNNHVKKNSFLKAFMVFWWKIVQVSFNLVIHVCVFIVEAYHVYFLTMQKCNGKSDFLVSALIF